MIEPSCRRAADRCNVAMPVLAVCSVLLAALRVGCAAPALPTASEPPAPSASSESEAPVPVDALRVREVAPSSQPLSSFPVHILSPRQQQRIDLEDAAGTPVRLDLGSLDAGAAVFVALDMHTPKRWHPDTAGRLANLQPHAAPLSPGLHRIVAFARGEDQRLLSVVNGSTALRVVWFAVGTSPSPQPPSSSLFLPCPHGTYSGPSRSSRVPLSLHVLGEPSAHPSVLRVRGPGASPNDSHLLWPGKPYVLENLQDGDYTLDVQLADPTGAPAAARWTRASREIVVNGDVPEDSTTTPPGAMLPPSAPP